MFHFYSEIKSTLNRMKYITLLVFTIALKFTYAQVTFYGSISRIYKVSFNEITYNGSAQNEPFIFPEFSFYEHPITFDQPKRTALDFGLTYKKHRLYLSLLNDAVSAQYFLSVQTYDSIDQKMIYYFSDGKNKTGQSRISLNYDYQLFGKKDHTNLFVNASFGWCRRSGPKEIKPAGTMAMGLNFTSDLYMNSVSSGYSDLVKNAFNFGIGLGADLYYKKHYILTLSASFAYSDQNLYFSENKITVYQNGQIQDYIITEKLLCAGIYFGVSRRFQIYPWKPINWDVVK